MSKYMNYNIYIPRYKKYRKEWRFKFQTELIDAIERNEYIDLDVFDDRKEINHFLEYFVLDYLTLYQIRFISTQYKTRYVEYLCKKIGCNYEKKRLAPGGGTKGGKSVWSVKTVGYKFG